MYKRQLQCQSKSASNQWETSTSSFKRWALTANAGPPEMFKIFFNRLTVWRNDTDPSPLHLTFPGTQRALTEQDLFGWQPVLEGVTSPAWLECLDVYFTSMGSRQSPRRWLAMIISKLLNISWDMWEHRNGIKPDDMVRQELSTKPDPHLNCQITTLYQKS